MKSRIEEHIKLVSSLESLGSEVNMFITALVHTFRNGGKVLVMGNGGSAADSQHFAAEMVGMFKHNRQPLPVIALTTDTSIITALGNDFSHNMIFKRQVQALAKKEDIVIGISTSGKSMNIFQALSYAKGIGCYTIGLLGSGGGIIKDICTLPIIIPSNETPRIQECHLLLLHLMSEKIEEVMFL